MCSPTAAARPRSRRTISACAAPRDNAGTGCRRRLQWRRRILDTIRFYTPNNTNTHRFGLTASLIWDITDHHRVRVAYTFDRAQHRQTGEWGYLDANGNPESPFSGRNATPVLDANGYQFQQRDRTSIAMLNQIAAQYIGRFFDDRLRVEVGLRMPFFKRELETFCPIQAARRFRLLHERAIRPRRRS